MLNLHVPLNTDLMFTFANTYCHCATDRNNQVLLFGNYEKVKVIRCL